MSLQTLTGRREVPILFSGPLVLALLAGRKTQTRRIPRTRPAPRKDARDESLFLPRCRIGDLLWVREAWCPADLWVNGHERDEPVSVRYRADGVALSWADTGRPVKLDTYAWSEPKRWRPSIHMPRWAARIFLEVTATSFDPLQSINASEALAEGIDHEDGVYPVITFAGLWDRINGERAPWTSNPTVEVIEFTVIEVKG